MTKSDTYRARLAALDDWDSYLMQQSGLPGPRGNLELVQVAADMGNEARFKHWLAFDAERAPTNTPGEFLAVCGVVGLGRLVAGNASVAKKRRHLKTIRACASDARWRVREGVAMALQRWGERDMPALLAEMETWLDGNLYELRAVAAALCEPKLLHEAANVKRVLKILDAITRVFAKSKNRTGDDFIALKKGLAYCWSVAVAASPEAGKRAMEKWFAADDAAVRWVMRENLKKDRLKRMDAAWVQVVTNSFVPPANE